MNKLIKKCYQKLDILPGRAERLKFGANGQELINGIDLDLKPETLTVFLGPNGAGKSLLLRLLHGLIEPKSGRILWGGKLMCNQIRKRQAMVFQRPVLLRRSVAANIDLVLNLRGQSDQQERDRILAEIGLLKKSRQNAQILSGGEQQSLSLARALSLSPDVLFLDEPTANLDPASTAAIENTVRSAHNKGTKVIFVTHDLGQARRLADEVVFLNRGKVAEVSPATQFFRNPISKSAQDFLSGRLVF